MQIRRLLRVVGCYAHFAYVLWYLGFEWRQQQHDKYTNSLINAAAEVWKPIRHSANESDKEG